MRFMDKLLAGLVVASLAACGGGGGGGAAAPTQAVLKVASVAKAGQNPALRGLEVTVLLPPGVTVKTVAASPKQTDVGVVKYSGIFGAGGSFSNVTSILFPRPAFGHYSGAKAPAKNTLKLLLASVANPPRTFGAGEFVTVVCDIAPGTTVTAADFTLSGFLPAGAGGESLAASFDAPTLTVDLQ